MIQLDFLYLIKYIVCCDAQIPVKDGEDLDNS